jgi:hypothetical protein
MKKVLAIIALAAFTFASCQKEEAAQPETTSLKTVSEKKDTSGWD